MQLRERLSALSVSDPIPEDPDEPAEIGVLPIANGERPARRFGPEASG